MEYYGHVSILKFGILELLEHSGLPGVHSYCFTLILET